MEKEANMKKITFVLFLTLMSLNSFAGVGERVCRAISHNSTRQDCMEFIQGQYFDDEVGYVCKRAKFNSGRFECLQVSANKRYTAQEGAECDDEGLDSNRIDCMRDYGVPVRQGGNRRMRQINHLSQSAAWKLRNGNVQGAMFDLQHIYNLSLPRGE